MNEKLLQHLALKLVNGKSDLIGKELSVQITPTTSVHFNSQSTKEMKSDDIFISNTHRSFSWHAFKSIEKFSDLLLRLNDLQELSRCKVLDLSFTSGLFAIIADQLGVKLACAFVHDLETLETNFKNNESKGKILSMEMLEKSGPFDLIFYDFRSLPSKKSLNVIATLVKKNRLLFVTGLLGHHVPEMNKVLRPYGLNPIYTGWNDELNFVLYSRKNK
jgi:hypothetical protein